MESPEDEGPRGTQGMADTVARLPALVCARSHQAGTSSSTQNCGPRGWRAWLARSAIVRCRTDRPAIRQYPAWQAPCTAC